MPAGRFFPSCLRLAAILLVLGAEQGAGQSPTPWRPFLHRALLDRSPVIVVARFEADDVLAPLGIQISRFKVLKSLRGAPGATILVGGIGDRGAALRDLDKLLFLAPLRSGRLFEVVDLVDLTAAEEVVAPATVAACLALDLEGSPGPVWRSLRDLSLRNLESASVFGARTALRELDALLDVAPRIFRPSDVARIQGAGAALPPSEAPLLQGLVSRMSRSLAEAFAGCEQAFEAGPDREAFLRLVAAWRGAPGTADRLRLLERASVEAGRRLRAFLEAVLHDPEPGLRIRAAWFLGEFGEEASAAPLLDGIQGAPDEERAARIEALGKIGRPESVSRLHPMLQDPAVFDAVLLALARIGGGEATDLLERVERRLTGVAGEEQRVQRIQDYRSADFGRQEARRRLKARQTYGP